MSDFTKRHLYTFEFKDRPRRALLWRKEVYQEWFAYAKLAGVGNYPDEFGNLEEFSDFESWWKHPEYGFELFCEPEEKPALVDESSPIH